VTFDREAAAIASVGNVARQAPFDDLPAGSAAPFQTLGVSIAPFGVHVTNVVDSYFGFAHCTYFCSASFPNFLNARGGFSARLPIDVNFVGFRVRMQGCPSGGAGLVRWRMYDTADQLIDSGAASVIGGCPGAGEAEQQ